MQSIRIRYAFMLASLICGLATGAPAPKPLPAEIAFPIGDWKVEWGACYQGMRFDSNGDYSSPQFGTGRWSADKEGYIWFTEGGDKISYAMWVDDKAGTGSGYPVYRSDDGINFGVEVRVRMERKK